MRRPRLGRVAVAQQALRALRRGKFDGADDGLALRSVELVAVAPRKGDGPESDTIDLRQAFVTLGNQKEFPLSLKAGRQELIYGEERLIGTAPWNNITRVFDAAKLRWQTPWFGLTFL